MSYDPHSSPDKSEAGRFDGDDQHGWSPDVEGKQTGAAA
jgi:hypothetical protein